MMKRVKKLWNAFWQDSHGKVVIYERPNALLIAWIVLRVLVWLLPQGRLENISQVLADIILIIWALPEITKGTSYFRRFLGVAVLLLTIRSLIG